MTPAFVEAETRHEKRLLAEWDQFQAEYRQLRLLQAYQIERLYARYKPRLDHYSFKVSMERRTEAPGAETD